MASLLNTLARPSITNEPPTEADLRRNDIAMFVLLIFALFLGLGVRNNQLTASRSIELNDSLDMSLPAAWIVSALDVFPITARNPRSPSIFDSEVVIGSRPVEADDTLVMARTNLGLGRTQELNRYRELLAEDVTVLDDEEAYLITYAYIADPTRESGAAAPPVVVQAQDLVFMYDDNLYVVTVASDAVEWDEAQTDISVVFDSLRLQQPGGDE